MIRLNYRIYNTFYGVQLFLSKYKFLIVILTLLIIFAACTAIVYIVDDYLTLDQLM